MNSIWIRNVAMAIIVFLIASALGELSQQKTARELALEKWEDFYSGNGPNPDEQRPHHQ